MSSWEPKAIRNPIDNLIASQMDEEFEPMCNNNNNNQANIPISSGKTNTSTNNCQQPSSTNSGRTESSSSSRCPEPTQSSGKSLPQENPSDVTTKVFPNLWNIPDKGTFRNPYFGGKNKGDSSWSKDKPSNNKSNVIENGKPVGKENNGTIKPKDGKLVNSATSKPLGRKDSVSIPFLDVKDDDDTDSINEPTTTDESEDSPTSPTVDIKVKGLSISGQEIKAESETTAVQNTPESKVGVNTTKALEKDVLNEPFSEKIPGLGSPKMPEDVAMAEPTPAAASEHKIDPIKEINEDKADKSLSEVSKNGEVIPSVSVKAVKEDTDDKAGVLANPIKKEEESPESKSSMNGSIDNGNKIKCIRIGCCNEVIENPDWDYEFCSAKCAVAHCKTAFENWVQSRRSELTEAP